MNKEVKRDTGISLRAYQVSDFQQWEDFISGSINGTIFHRQKFLKYHPEGRFTNNSLLFFEAKNNRLLSVFPASIVEHNGQKILKSHPGSSYGGFVFDHKISLRRIYSILETLDQYCFDKNVGAIEFRQAPKIFNFQFCDQLDYALAKNGYVRFYEELATFYDLSEFDNPDNFEDFLIQFPQKTRNEIRKAHTNGIYTEVVTGETDLIKFYEILSQNLMDKHGMKPVHTLEEIKKLIELFPERVFVYGIYKDKKLIGGFLVLQVNAKGWHVFYAPIDYTYQDFRPLNLGVARLIQYAKNSNVAVLNYGVSTPDSGRKVNWGLLRFKENFNGNGILRTYWRKEVSHGG